MTTRPENWGQRIGVRPRFHSFSSDGVTAKLGNYEYVQSLI